MMVVVALGVGLLPKIPQDSAYHAFADTSVWQGIPRAGDVVSSLAFVMVGLLGIRFVASLPPIKPEEGLAFAIATFTFFFGLALVGIASAYYHQNPSTERLFWDRAAMGIPTMALVSIIMIERVGRRAGIVILPVLLALSVAGALHWEFSEAAEASDLRVYAFTQGAPVLAALLIVMLFPGRHRDTNFFAITIGCYGASRLFEIFDHEVFAALSQTISGHSLKHLTLAVAAYTVLRMLREHRAQEEAR
ncbi:MAG: alkaline phytoceramidase [Rhodospirillales bacterium]|nr:alkaline phytoceramidase [Rhodospirillales bacterium]